MMEVGIPLRGGKAEKTEWVKVRYDRADRGVETVKRIKVSASPLEVTIHPWLEGGATSIPPQVTGEGKKTQEAPPGYLGYKFEPGQEASVTVRIDGK